MTQYYPIEERFIYPPPITGRPGYLAKYSGEKRCPWKGEHYLSGAHIMAYKAPNDLDTVYQIAKIVKVRKRIIIEEL